MKAFDDRLTRGAVWLLLFNGLLAAIVGAVVWHAAQDLHSYPLGTPSWRILPALIGGPVAMVAGFTIILLSCWRLRKSFNPGMKSSLLTGCLTGVMPFDVMILFYAVGFCDSAVGAKVFLSIVPLNFLLILLFGRRKPPQSPKI